MGVITAVIDVTEVTVTECILCRMFCNVGVVFCNFIHLCTRVSVCLSVCVYTCVCVLVVACVSSPWSAHVSCQQLEEGNTSDHWAHGDRWASWTLQVYRQVTLQVYRQVRLTDTTGVQTGEPHWYYRCIDRWASLILQVYRQVSLTDTTGVQTGEPRLHYRCTDRWASLTLQVYRQVSLA